MQIIFLRAKEAQQLASFPRSSFYAKVRDNLLPPPVHIGERCVAWIKSEIDSVNFARMQGKSDEEIRALVSQLVNARTAAVGE